MNNTLWDQLEDRLGLKPGTLAHLHDEQGDWGRIVKAHAVVEATLNVRLARRFPDLARVVTRLPFEHGLYGKLKTLRQGGWLQPNEEAFAQALYNLRSRLVHDVSYLDFDLDEVTDRWSRENRARFVDAVFEFWHASNKLNLNAEWREAERENVRLLLFAATFRFMYDTDDLLRAAT